MHLHTYRLGQKLIHRVQKNFFLWGGEHFLRKGHLMSKINIIFFIKNLILNIFILNNFFEKSIFSEETKKKTVLGKPN